MQCIMFIHWNGGGHLREAQSRFTQLWVSSLRRGKMWYIVVGREEQVYISGKKVHKYHRVLSAKKVIYRSR